MEKEHSMIKEFEICGFKKFDQIKFDDLGRINLFLGNNNTGKTSILEAVYAYSCGQSVSAMISNCFFRNKKSNNKYDFLEKIISFVNDQNELPFEFSFSAKVDEDEVVRFEHTISPGGVLADIKPNLTKSFGNREIEKKSISKDDLNSDLVMYSYLWAKKMKEEDPDLIEAFILQEEIMKIKSELLKLDYVDIADWKVKSVDQRVVSYNLTFPFKKDITKPNQLCRFIDILSHRDQEENAKIFSFIQREDLLEEFKQELSKVFTEVEDIEAVLYPDGTVGFVGLKIKDKGLLPLYNFGDGMQRWFNLLGGMIVYQNALHCIEEIDATMHPVAQKNLGANLVYYAQKYNNQIFMTSHSLEFVDHLLDGVYGSGEEVDDQIRIFTLKEDAKGKTKVRKLTGKEAYESREKYKLELR